TLTATRRHRGADPMDWVPTRALGRAILVAGVLLLLAAVFGRVDLVVLAAPFALGTALSLRRRPVSTPDLRLSTVESFAAEGTEVSVELHLANPDPVGSDLALIRLAVPPWVRLRHGDRPYVAPVGPDEVADIALAGPALRWGRHHVGPAAAHAVACDGLLVSA